MPFDDDRVDVGGVDDRRGRGRGGLGGMPIAVGGGGLGLVGLLVVVAMTVFGGGDLLGTGGAGLVGDNTGVQESSETTEQLRQRCNASGAIDRYDDCYLIKSYNEINEVWDAELARRNFDYRQPTLVFFERQTQTRCGPASSDVGPFYCPPDQAVFFDLTFLRELQRRFGAEGRYAQTYIVAHEVGHHMQNLFGTERRVREQQGRSESRDRELSIALELQADCYAGAWSALANRAGNFSITERELDQALNAAAAVGDDRIQQKTQGRIDPESWTHGSAEQRREWFLRGYQTADIDRCNTFG